MVQNTLSFIFLDSLPPLLLIVVIFYALSEGSSFGFLAGCWAGFLVDLFGVGQLGYGMAVYGFIGVASGFIALKIFRDSVFTKFILPGLATYAATLLSLMVARFSAQEAVTTGILVEAFFWPHLLGVIVISPFLFSFLKFVSFMGRDGRTLRRVW